MTVQNILATMLTSMDSDTVAPYGRALSFMKALTNVPQWDVQEVTAVPASTVPVATPGTAKVVIAVNEADGTFAIKFEGMATSTAVKVNATGPAITVAANMITIAEDLVTIGNDAELNQTGQIHILSLIGQA